MLAAGTTLGPNAIGYLSTAVKSAGEPEVRKFYQFLVDWEKQHLEAPRTLYNSVCTDFFAAGSFSPF